MRGVRRAVRPQPEVPHPGRSPRGRRPGLRVLLTLLTCLGPAIASAHGRSVSYSVWEIGPEATSVSLRLKLLELSRLGPEALPPGSVAGAPPVGAPDLAARAFPRQLVLLADDQPCPATGPARRQADEPGWVRYRWRVDCPAEARTLKIRTRLLLEVAPSHLHFARVRGLAGEAEAREQVLTEAAPELVVRGPERATAGDAIGSRFVDYVGLGIEHILTGWDHLAFVFGLLLLAGRLGEVARLVTGFTLAHSATLALAVLDRVHPRGDAVEAVIAFSVMLVAIEKAWLVSGRSRWLPGSVLAGLAGLGVASALGVASLPLLTVAGLVVFTASYFALVARSRSEWLRICLTFAFGLVHGFGFAGILVEMTLPSDRLVPALLGFNLGVEAGQLGVVLLLWPLLWLGRRLGSEPLRRLSTELSTAALCGLGAYWLLQRAFSL